MRYSAFEQAAAEASYGMHEIDTQLEQFRTQLEQIKSQMEQMQSKRVLLERLSQELLLLKPERTTPATFERAEAPPPQAEPPRSLREAWATPLPESDDRPPAESILRGRI